MNSERLVRRLTYLAVFYSFQVTYSLEKYDLTTANPIHFLFT